MHAMTRLSTRHAWLPAAAGLLGAAWGSNQFTPMLLVYHRTLGLRTGTLEALFGAYAIGLIPGLLVGGRLSDTRGRRAIVMPAALLSLAGSVVLAGAGDTVGLLFAGRLLAGLSSGAMFGAGTAWLRELSARSGEHATHAAARRAVVAMTAGFAFGPLVAGVLAQWAPHAGVIPYVPHIALAVAVIALLRDAPETVVARPAAATVAALPQRGRARFRRVVVPSAPRVFAAPAIAFALPPAVVGTDHAADGRAFVAAVTALPAFAGVLVRPLARRLEHRAGVAGLVVLAAGLGLAAVTAETQLLWLLVPCAIVLGCAYGLCLVAGLLEVGQLADDDELAALTAAYYALTYLGFAAPYLLALAAHVASYPVSLSIAAALALSTAPRVARHSARHPEAPA